jgi:hypothetical protein
VQAPAGQVMVRAVDAMNNIGVAGTSGGR